MDRNLTKELSGRPEYHRFCNMLLPYIEKGMIPELNDFIVLSMVDTITNLSDHKAQILVRDLMKVYYHNKEEIENVSKRDDFLEWLYRRIDKNIAMQLKMNSRKPSCGKGCTACCHLYIHISQPEADNLYPHVDDWDKLKKQYDVITEHGGEMFPHHAGRELAKCIFLKNNECSVYDKRPLSCRVYYVQTDPSLCDVFKNPNGMVGHIIFTKAEVTRGIMQGKYPGGGLQELLLKKKGII